MSYWVYVTKEIFRALGLQEDFCVEWESLTTTRCKNKRTKAEKQYKNILRAFLAIVVWRKWRKLLRRWKDKTWSTKWQHGKRRKKVLKKTKNQAHKWHKKSCKWATKNTQLKNIHLEIWKPNNQLVYSWTRHSCNFIQTLTQLKLNNLWNFGSLFTRDSASFLTNQCSLIAIVARQS